jgi:hypothetical protein
MPQYQASSQSLEDAKNSGRETIDRTKQSGKDAEKDTKRWGQDVKESAGDAWESTKRWGNENRRRVEDTFDGFVDLGHPLINRVFDGFVKVGGVGALHAASQDSYRFLLSEETNKKTLEQSFQRIGKDAVQWGLVAAVYSGTTYGIQEARGVHDWKNALLGGALTGAALSLTEQNPGTDRVLRGAITGGAIATAAEILRNIT